MDVALQKVKQMQLEKVRALVAQRHIHGSVREFTVAGTAYKMLFYPAKRRCAPLYIDIHGGGFCWGMMEEGDLFCHRINERFDCAVIAPDYPLGPETRFPAAQEHLYRLIEYLYDTPQELGINPQRIVVGGRSAGGNLAATLCLLAKKRGKFMFAAQVLDHPCLDISHLLDDRLRYAGEGALTPSIMEALAVAYADLNDRNSILCSPVRATKEELKGLPPAVIQTCELDSLQIDGETYAKMLEDAGVPVEYHCYQGVLHGFTETEGPEEENGIQWLMDALEKVTKGLEA